VPHLGIPRPAQQVHLTRNNSRVSLRSLDPAPAFVFSWHTDPRNGFSQNVTSSNLARVADGNCLQVSTTSMTSFGTLDNAQALFAVQF